MDQHFKYTLFLLQIKSFIVLVKMLKIYNRACLYFSICFQYPDGSQVNKAVQNFAEFLALRLNGIFG